MGRVLDVTVDIRLDSPTFGKWELFELDGKSIKMVYIPIGFAHGFLALEVYILINVRQLITMLQKEE